MRGRHHKPPAVPRWLASAGLGAAAMMIGSLAFASPESARLVGATASVALPTFTPDPPVEPPMAPPAPVVDTSVVATPHRRVPAEKAGSVDTTSKRVRKSPTESDRTTTTTKPKSTAATTMTKSKPTTTTTPKPTTVQASTTKEKSVALSTCGGGSLAGTTASVSAAGRQIMAATGFSGTVYGRVGRAGGGDHPKGRALDFMTSEGSAILAYVRSHFGELGATYAIYRQTYYPARGGSKHMEDRGGATANHLDHVHVSFGAGGGPSC